MSRTTEQPPAKVNPAPRRESRRQVEGDCLALRELATPEAFPSQPAGGSPRNGGSGHAFDLRGLIGAMTAFALAAVTAGAAFAQTTVIVGGRVVTNGPGGIIDGGTVVIEGDRIVAVGADVPAPDGAVVIDAAGKWVTPGLFSAAGQTGLVEVELEPATDDRASTPLAPFSVALEAADGFNPAAENVASARSDGVTRVALTPTSASGLFGGLGAVVDTSGAPGSADAPPALVAASLAADRIDLVGGARPAAFAYLEAALDDAAAYPDLLEDAQGEVLKPRDAAALAAVVRGEIPLVIAADRASDLRALAALASRREGLRLIVLGGGEAHLAADALAGAGIPVILDPSRNLPSTFDRVAASAATAAALEAAGVDFAIAALDELVANPGYMAQFAGVAVAHGLPWAAAFDAVTGAPARMLGLGSDLGALEPGKLADVVIWDGDPLEVMSGAERVFVAGVERPARSRQSALRDRYLEPLTEQDISRAYIRP